MAVGLLGSLLALAPARAQPDFTAFTSTHTQAFSKPKAAKKFDEFTLASLQTGLAAVADGFERVIQCTMRVKREGRRVKAVKFSLDGNIVDFGLGPVKDLPRKTAKTDKKGRKVLTFPIGSSIPVGLSTIITFDVKFKNRKKIDFAYTECSLRDQPK